MKNNVGRLYRYGMPYEAETSYELFLNRQPSGNERSGGKLVGTYIIPRSRTETVTKAIKEFHGQQDLLIEKIALILDLTQEIGMDWKENRKEK